MSAVLAHIALWSDRPETLRDFYVRYFGGTSGAAYVNPAKRFKSYFVAFGDGGCRMEIMRRVGLGEAPDRTCIGYCHVAFALPDCEQVRQRTERLRRDGYRIVGEPRTTGDGYYESVVADPDGNLVEIVCEKI